MSARRGRDGSKPVGRPPGGTRPGEKVNEYPQLGIRVPPEVKATITAISTVQHKTQWRIIVAAVDLYLAQMSAKDRETVRHVAGTTAKGRRSVSDD